MAKVDVLSDPVPVRLGKDPVAPLYVPAPPVTVAEPVRAPPVRAAVIAVPGIFSVPVILSLPPVIVMLYAPL
jgi:hypothetical protein